MQIQPVNNSPDFQANHLRTAQILNKKNKINLIDIYSINKSDKNLIDNLLLKINTKKRLDNYGVREKNNVNDTVSYLLRKASMLDAEAKDGVYIAVKNGKQVTGILDYTDGGIPLLKNLTVWSGGNKEASRKNLFTEFLRHVERRNNSSAEPSDIFVYAEPKSKGNKWLKESGFMPAEKNRNVIRERLKMDALVIGQNARKLEFDVEFVTDMKNKQVELDSNLEI